MNNKYGVDTFADKNSPSSLDRKVILELYLAYDRKDNHGNLGREFARVSRAITIVGRQLPQNQWKRKTRHVCNENVDRLSWTNKRERGGRRGAQQILYDA